MFKQQKATALNNKSRNSSLELRLSITYKLELKFYPIQGHSHTSRTT